MSYTKQSGFTLIEMIVSLAVFSFVVTIAIGALLMLMSASKRLQGEQSVMTNLSFALDAMTREIRTGTFYYCATGNSNSNSSIFNPSVSLEDLGDQTNDCPNGAQGNKYHGLAFKEGGNSITATNERILYYYDPEFGKIYRRVGGGAAESIVSSGIFIKDMEFVVTGTQKLVNSSNVITNNVEQPTVTLYIEAAETNDITAKTYTLQTTVTQRTLDL